MTQLFDTLGFIEMSAVRAGAEATAHDEAAASAESTRAGVAVSLEQVGKVFATPRGRTAALRDVTLDVRRGEVFGIIGRSGAGKSTLLRLVNGLERPKPGRVRVQGVDVGALDEDGLVALRRRTGMVFQHFNLLSAKTVFENVALPLKIAGVPKAERARKVEALLDLVEAAAKRDAYPASLSGGQKQRVGIARALVHDPEVLLCDEATSALDPETTQSILALLADINRRLGLTIVLITHEMEVIRAVCDTVAVIEQGEVVETATCGACSAIRATARRARCSARSCTTCRPNWPRACSRCRNKPRCLKARRSCSTSAIRARAAASRMSARLQWRSAARCGSCTAGSSASRGTHRGGS